MALPLNLPQAPELAPVAEWDAMIADYATTGLTVHRHPMRLLRPGLQARGTVTSADLARLRHGASVSIGGLVVARQRPGTAKGVVFLLIEDEAGTVNLIVPPQVYERDRLTVRTEPLVLVDGTLERHAAAGGAINVLVRRIVPLDAADLRTERPAATVKDFSPLDERERRRILEEQPLVAVAGGAAGPADPGPASAPPARGGAIAAVGSSGGDAMATGDGGGSAGGPRAAAPDVDAADAGRTAPVGPVADGIERGSPATGGTGASRLGADHGPGDSSSRPGHSAAPRNAPRKGDRALSLAGEGETHEGEPDRSPGDDSEQRERKPTDGRVREHGGAEDFRAVAPPIMSFAQGRRR
jgi:error-prone DNA polymerase